MRFSIDDGIAPANDGADHFPELGAAEAALGALIEQAVEQALAFSKQTGSASAEVPRVLVDASMGLGKSWQAMRALARLLQPGQIVWVALPTLALAEEAAVAFARSCEDLGVNHQHFLLRGRGAPNPSAPEQTMCRRSDLTARLAKLSGRVGSLLCQPATGPHCPLAQSCAHLALRAAARSSVMQQGGVLFVTHAHLFVTEALPKPDFVVLDESILLAAVSTVGLPMETLRRARKQAADGPFKRVLAGVIEALETAPGTELVALRTASPAVQPVGLPGKSCAPSGTPRQRRLRRFRL